MKLLLVVFALLSSSLAQNLRKYGDLSVPKPSTLAWFTETNATDVRDRLNLLCDTYNSAPNSNDNTYIYRNIGRYIPSVGQAPRLQISNGLSGPRNIHQAPNNAMGEPLVTMNDGVNILGKQRGSINVARVADWGNIPTNKLAGNVGFNPQLAYQSSFWMHANTDPFMDCFTCRADLNANPVQSELLILMQPAIAPYVRFWDEVSIHNNSCDSFVKRVIINAPTGGAPPRRNYDVLFTTGYHSRQLMITWTTTPTGFWQNPEQIFHKVLSTGSRFFFIETGDLNKDGKDDVMVTIRDTANGRIDVYSVPDDFKTQDFTSRTIMTGLNSGSEGTPGQVKVFYPNLRDTSAKPYIAVAGANNGRAYYLVPESQDPNNWTYRQVEVNVASGVAGHVSGVEVGDVNDDGWCELFFSVLNRDIIQVWTFAP